jgi:hypothetical protein
MTTIPNFADLPLRTDRRDAGPTGTSAFGGMHAQ